MSSGASVNSAQKSGLKSLLKMVYSRMAKSEDEDEKKEAESKEEKEPEVEAKLEESSEDTIEMKDKIREMFQGASRKKPSGVMIQMKKETVVPIKSAAPDRMAAARAAKAAKRGK